MTPARLATLVLALLAAPATADTLCAYGDPGTTATIAPGDETFAVVTINNALAITMRHRCTLTLFGVHVTVVYEPAQRKAPDWFHVTVPPGFLAVPESILIDDGASDIVLIVLTNGDGA